MSQQQFLLSFTVHIQKKSFLGPLLNTASSFIKTNRLNFFMQLL